MATLPNNLHIAHIRDSILAPFFKGTWCTDGSHLSPDPWCAHPEKCILIRDDGYFALIHASDESTVLAGYKLQPCDIGSLWLLRQLRREKAEKARKDMKATKSGAQMPGSFEVGGDFSEGAEEYGSFEDYDRYLDSAELTLGDTDMVSERSVSNDSSDRNPQKTDLDVHQTASTIDAATHMTPPNRTEKSSVHVEQSASTIDSPLRDFGGRGGYDREFYEGFGDIFGRGDYTGGAGGRDEYDGGAHGGRGGAAADLTPLSAQHSASTTSPATHLIPQQVLQSASTIGTAPWGTTLPQRPSTMTPPPQRPWGSTINVATNLATPHVHQSASTTNPATHLTPPRRTETPKRTENILNKFPESHIAEIEVSLCD